MYLIFRFLFGGKVWGEGGSMPISKGLGCERLIEHLIRVLAI